MSANAVIPAVWALVGSGLLALTLRALRRERRADDRAVAQMHGPLLDNVRYVQRTRSSEETAEFAVVHRGRHRAGRHRARRQPAGRPVDTRPPLRGQR